MQKIKIKECSAHDAWPVLVLDGGRVVYRCKTCKRTEVRDEERKAA